jgi:hypothetical protein
MQGRPCSAPRCSGTECFTHNPKQCAHNMCAALCSRGRSTPVLQLLVVLQVFHVCICQQLLCCSRHASRRQRLLLLPLLIELCKGRVRSRAQQLHQHLRVGVRRRARGSGCEGSSSTAQRECHVSGTLLLRCKGLSVHVAVCVLDQLQQAGVCVVGTCSTAAQRRVTFMLQRLCAPRP